jgi:glycosyltransferase involved in cell wall biosynthesis
MLLDTEFPPDIRVENEAQSLLAAGHEVHILCYMFASGKQAENYNGINIHRVRIPRQIAKKSLGLINQLPFYKWFWKRSINNLLNTNKFDAVHFHDLPLCCLISSLKENKQLQMVADMHENYPYLVAEQPYMNSWFGKTFLSKKIWFANEKKWLLQADHILCVAPEMKTRLDQVLNHSKDISIVPNTLNFNTFVKSQTPLPNLSERFENRFVVSFIGGIDAVRGIEYLIEAAEILSNQIPELTVLIVGEGQSLELLKAKAAQTSIPQNIVFEGFKPSKYMQAYIEISQICVIPHIRSVQTDNSSPNKLFQYMYFGKPVISSNCISLEKLILAENCGLIFNDRQSKDLADKILLLYQKPELIQQLGANGHEAVMKKYNWAATSLGLLKVYEPKNPN